MAISVNITGDGLTGLNELVKKMGNTAPLMQAISSALLRETEANFDEEGRPDWLPLKPSTKAQRAEKGYTGKTLQRTGQLAASITIQHSATEAAVGTNKVYGAIQQFGGTIPARTIYPKRKRALWWAGLFSPVKKANVPATKIPARPYLPYVNGALQPEAKQSIQDVINHYLVKVNQ